MSAIRRRTAWCRLLPNQERANTERKFFGKLRELGEIDADNVDIFGTDTTTPYYSSCRDIEHGKSAQGCVMYTVVYGKKADALP